MAKQRQQYLVAAVCFMVVLAFLFTEFHHQNVGLHMPLYGKKNASKSTAGYRLQFPASFPQDIKQRDLIKNIPAFRLSGLRYSRVIKQKHAAEYLGGNRRLWSTSMLRIFGFDGDIALDLARCKQLLVSNSTLSVSPKRNLNVALQRIVARIVRDMDRGQDSYLNELRPYLDPQIRLQVKHNVVDKFWFNMAGSSVFLKEYGYHMMVSRLAYSSEGLRNNPQFSIAYAQLYDTNWTEVEDVALVAPTNMHSMDHDRFFSVQDRNYTIVHYPSVIQVPFFHDYKDPELKYLGPEDARVVLVQNKAGHEEPLLVYNLFHPKPVLLNDDEDEFVLKQERLFRSMWVSWPWQFQRGKFAVDDEKFQDSIYNRAKELEIKNTRRQENQKNWTPFVSEVSRASCGFDRYLFLVYRWTRLQVLKCDFTLQNGKCGFVYSAQKNLRITLKIGPLRGGTPMVNLNSILRENPKVPVAEMVPEGREIWAGFARAHLVRCGCGNDFYRPNVVVLVKDSSVDETGKKVDFFKLSHISSFASLNVDVIPWDPLWPLDICKGTNAVIPNGISSWKVHKVQKNGGQWQADDLLSLALSVSDCTVDVIHILGLIQTLMNMPDHLLFLPPSDEQQTRDASVDRIRKAYAKTPSSTNDNVVCAMEESSNFCTIYGIFAGRKDG